MIVQCSADDIFKKRCTGQFFFILLPRRLFLPNLREALFSPYVKAHAGKVNAARVLWCAPKGRAAEENAVRRAAKGRRTQGFSSKSRNFLLSAQKKICEPFCEIRAKHFFIPLINTCENENHTFRFRTQFARERLSG